MTGAVKNSRSGRIAVWALTTAGADLARRIAAPYPDCDVMLSERLAATTEDAVFFNRLPEAVAERFRQYAGHVFVMAAGIVVRAIASRIRHKTVDPAVVVVDEKGRFVVSLLSGHIGGANRLAKDIARRIEAEPVITTATDIHQLPAIDLLAQELGLAIENPEAIKTVHMAVLAGEPILSHDPWELLGEAISSRLVPYSPEKENGRNEEIRPTAGIFVDDVLAKLPAGFLILRPKTLVAGIGCNRNTPAAEIEDVLFSVFRKFALSIQSLSRMATIDIKADEPGLLSLSEQLRIPIALYDKSELARVEGVPTPSRRVEQHVGVGSVCEAAAILSAEPGKLIVPKQIGRNVTVAVARKSSMW